MFHHLWQIGRGQNPVPTPPEMEYITWGRAGLKTSVMGLGSGGKSRLGLAAGKSPDRAIAILHQALELGINLIDTAQSYGTEKVIGKALRSFKRGDFVLSTKQGIRKGSQWLSPRELVWAVDKSLFRLKTHYIDIYHLHGVTASEYDRAVEIYLPTLQKLRQAGKIRALGITEPFATDTSHQMLAKAVQGDSWDVVMAGYNFLNPSARSRLFPQTQARNIGVLSMFAVRRALSNLAAFEEAIATMQQRQLIEPIEAKELYTWLLNECDTTGLTEIAYRYCRHESGTDVVLFGTGNPDHLKANVAALLRPPLPQIVCERLDRIFGAVDQFSGN